MTSFLHDIYFLLYAAASVMGSLCYLLGRDRKYCLALYTLLCAWLLNGLYIGARWLQAGRILLADMYDATVFLFWAFVGIFLLFRRFRGVQLDRLVTWAALLAVAGTAGTVLLPSGPAPLPGSGPSGWLTAHLGMSLTAYAALLQCALCGAYYFFCGDDNREAVELAAYRAGLAGLGLLSLGLLLGLAWAFSAGGGSWAWGAREAWSLLIWSFYAAAVRLRRLPGWRGRKFAHLVLWGFLLVLAKYGALLYSGSDLHG